MKRVLLSLILISGLTFCNTPQTMTEVKDNQVCPITKCDKSSGLKDKISKLVVKDPKNPNGKPVLEMDASEFETIFAYADRYINILKITQDEKALKKVVKIIKSDENTYKVTVALDDNVNITSTLVISNDELFKLREKMKKMHEQKPEVNVIRIDNTKFKIKMSVEDIVWSVDVDVEKQARAFDWYHFLLGVLSVISIAAASAVKMAIFIPLL